MNTKLNANPLLLQELQYADRRTALISRGPLGDNGTSQEKLQRQRDLTGCLTSRHRKYISLKAGENCVSKKKMASGDM